MFMFFDDFVGVSIAFAAIIVTAVGGCTAITVLASVAVTLFYGQAWEFEVYFVHQFKMETLPLKVQPIYHNLSHERVFQIQSA